MCCVELGAHIQAFTFSSKITVGCLTSTYPSIQLKTLSRSRSVACGAHPSIHFSLDEDTSTVGCPLCAYPSIHLSLELSQDGRLPAVHISKHSQQKLAHVRAVGTSTRAVACACAFTVDPQPRWFEFTLTFRALRRNHLVSTLFEANAFTTSPETTKKIFFFVTRESIQENRTHVTIVMCDMFFLARLDNGILQDTALCTSSPTLLSFCSVLMPGILGLVDDRRELHARSIITSKFSVACTAASATTAATSSSAIVGKCEQGGKQSGNQKCF